MKRSAYLACLAVFVSGWSTGCSKKIEGPAPSVSGVLPAAVCRAQITTPVQLSGVGLSPLYTSALNKGRLELPRITLTQVQGPDGAAATGNPIAIPDDPLSQATSQVRWSNQQMMSFDVTPALMLAPGLYDVSVANANGKQGVFPASLLAVPPPSVVSVSSDLLCGGKENIFTIVGDYFIQTSEGMKPQIAIGGGTFAPTAMSDCRPLPGTAGLQACRSLSLTLFAGALAPGAYPIKVTNPAPVGCGSTDAVVLTIVPEPVVAKVEPAAACAADGAVNVKISGTGFLTVGATGPTVKIGELALPSTVAGCSPVMGPAATVQSCTELTVSVPMATAAGSYSVTVHNPPPADCHSAPGPMFHLIDRPMIAEVAPAAVCTQAGDTAVVLTGTNFVTVGGMAPSVSVGGKLLVAMAASCNAMPGTDPAIEVCTKLTVTVKPADHTVGPHAVTVTNPAPVSCGSVGQTTLQIAGVPTLTAVAPTNVCAGSAVITLTGINFSQAAGVKLNGVAARTVTVNQAGTSAVAEFGGGLEAGGPYDVSIENGGGCSATLAMKVTVVPGPQVFFLDPSVVFNGINTQATLYGTGYSGAVQAVELRKEGATPIPLTFTQSVQQPNQVQVLIPKGTPGGSYDVRLKDTSSCNADLSAAVTITSETNLALAAPPMTPPFGWQQESTATTLAARSVTEGFAAVPRVYLNPANPGNDTVATALGAITFIDKTQLSALVPRGLPPGKYDLIVVNPDGKVGVAQGAFEVTTLPPPTISTLSPGSVANSTTATFSIVGENFRMPAVSLLCVDSAGTALPSSPAATVSASTATNIDVQFNASLGGVACVVRVTNTDDKTYGDFSALVITNPSLNLTAAKQGPDLTQARRAPVTLAGDASNAARYVHVVGGDDAAQTTFDTVDTAPLTLLGVPQKFFAQKNKLNQPRAFAGGARIGRFLYVAGGGAATTALDTVERAAVLSPEDRGEIVDLLLEVKDQGLPQGVWYYRVASVLKADDAFNPGGENLPSDPFPVRLPEVPNKKLQVTVIWKADPTAAKYRIYRSKEAGATVGTEQLIAEVDAAVTSFKDVAAAPIAADMPLPVGSLGRWQTLAAKLARPRQGAGVTWAVDPADNSKAYLYVIGGRQDVSTALASYEFLPISIDASGSQAAAGAFVPGANSLGSARWQLAAAQATHELSPRIPLGQTLIYALSGVAANGATMVKDAEAALVQAGGQLGAFADINGNAGSGNAGYVSMVAGNLVFAFGGANAMPSATINSGEICATGVMGCAGKTAPVVSNFNAGQDMLQARYLMGGTLSGAFIYITGGVGSGGAALASTEYRIW